MGKSSKRTLDQATASDAAAPAAMEVDSAAPPAVASPTKKSKKDKKDKSGAAGAAEGDDKEVGLEQLAEIAKPLAVKKTGKHVLRLVKKGESSSPPVTHLAGPVGRSQSTGTRSMHV